MTQPSRLLSIPAYCRASSWTLKSHRRRHYQELDASPVHVPASQAETNSAAACCCAKATVALHFAYDVFETLELSIAVPNSSAHVSQTLGEIVDGLGHWHHALGCSAGCCFEPLLCDRAVFQHLGPHRSKFFDELAHLFPALCTSFAQSLLQVPNASPFRPDCASSVR
eukprot:CAMPEP_0117607922 /NCGR_PEP_ID=MMETSP0784-20121206/80534_1 /TAXON_ID=39447 /ORGANISM="" /LENGTH=167 /DNA_ID=CAMNT_0005411163 /DNA_START=24 /DNA_END=528 /DNA_ORIENTATION=+